MATGVELIAQERERQVTEEGWSAEHDDGHVRAELAWAAVCYAAPANIYYKDDSEPGGICFGDPWPWDYHWDKREYNGNVLIPADRCPNAERIRMLVKAGALIAAEIDRLLRLK